MFKDGKPVLSAKLVVRDYLASTLPDDREASTFAIWLQNYRKELSGYAISADKSIRNHLTSIGFARLAAFETMAKKTKQTPTPITPNRQLRSVWKGAVQIGMITLPIKIYAGARPNRVGFKLLHESCGGRINRGSDHCKACEVDIDGVAEKIVKGYEYTKDSYIVLTAEEIEAQVPETSSLAEVAAFVPASEVDPIFFEGSYYLLPGEGGQKAYELVRQGMLDTKTVAVGKISMFGSEHVIVLRPFSGGIALHLLYYLDEVNAITYPEPVEITKKEAGMGKMLIENMSETFDPSQYTDDYAANIRALAMAKLGNVAAKTLVKKPVVKAPASLEMALAASIAAAKRKKAA
jgi:DNA end-binding protein Ku